MSLLLLEKIGPVKQLHGEPFYADKIPEAQKAAQEYAKNGGFVASMPVLVQGFPYTNWLTANSEDISGVDKHGKFGPMKGHVVVTVHGGKDGWGLLTSKINERALAMHREGKGRGLNEVYAVRLSDVYDKDVFTDLLNGGLPDGRSIQVLPYEVIKSDGAPQDFTTYAVVRTLELTQKTDSGYKPIKRLLQLDNNGIITQVTDSQVIAYTGGASQARTFMQKVMQHYKSKNYGVWHPFNSNKFNPDEAQGRVLFLCNDDDYGLYGDNSMYDIGRSVGVAPEALATFESVIIQPSLEDILAVIDRSNDLVATDSMQPLKARLASKWK